MTITRHVFKPEFIITHDDETNTLSYQFGWISSHDGSYTETYSSELYYGDHEELIDMVTLHVDTLLAEGHLPDGTWYPQPLDPEVINAALHFLTTIANTDDHK